MLLADVVVVVLFNNAVVRLEVVTEGVELEGKDDEGGLDVETFDGVEDFTVVTFEICDVVSNVVETNLVEVTLLILVDAVVGVAVVLFVNAAVLFADVGVVVLFTNAVVLLDVITERVDLEGDDDEDGLNVETFDGVEDFMVVTFEIFDVV